MIKDTDTYSQNTTFFAGFNSSWCAIKFSSNEKIRIDKLWVATSIENAIRNDYWCFVLFDSNKTTYDYGGVAGGIENYSDFFFHIHFPFLNFTYDHFDRVNFSAFGEYPRYNLTLPSGIYYLVAIHPHPTGTLCNFKIGINATSNISFLGTSQGNETYLLDETDFLGRLNIYSFNHSLIWAGTKKIKISNTLVGSICLYGNMGVTKIKIKTPDRKIKKVTVFDTQKKIYVIGDKEMLFRERYILPIGESGEWNFEINRMESHGCPDILFIYGDVKLP